MNKIDKLIIKKIAILARNDSPLATITAAELLTNFPTILRQAISLERLIEIDNFADGYLSPARQKQSDDLIDEICNRLEADFSNGSEVRGALRPLTEQTKPKKPPFWAFWK